MNPKHSVATGLGYERIALFPVSISKTFPREFATFMALFRSNQDSESIRQQGLALLDAIAVQITTRGEQVLAGT